MDCIYVYTHVTYEMTLDSPYDEVGDGWLMMNVKRH